jgi:hypothetical protein
MDNNYFQFKGEFYHQVKGTAMGTPVAPVFANIFMFILERKILQKYGNQIVYYRRYLDDILLCVNGDVDAIKTSLSNMEKFIKLDFNISDKTATFLDLIIFKGERFKKNGILDLKVHQKQLNKYLYIPYTSYHTENSKLGFIITELQRYARNSSSRRDFIDIKKLFWTRLRARGFPSHLLTTQFKKVRYDERHLFIYGKKPGPQQGTSNTQAAHPVVYFTTTFNPLVKAINVKKLLTEYLPSTITFKPRVGFKVAKNLFKILCKNRSMPST